MKLIGIALGVLGCVAGCGSSSSSPGDELVGHWAYADANGTTGEALNVNADGTYQLILLQATSASAANIQEEDGTYAATNAEVTTTPTKWSCPGPDPASTISYKVSSGELVLSEPSGAIVMQPNPPTSGSYAFTMGCFAGGVFTAMPLAPVSN